MRNLTFCLFSQYLVSPGRRYLRLCANKMAVNAHRLRGFLFWILNVVIFIIFVMVSNICVGEDILSHKFIFTLLCSHFYWFCFPVSNKGSVLLEKSNLKPLASENSLLLFSCQDCVLWRREKFLVYTHTIFKYILSLPLLDFLQSFNQLCLFLVYIFLFSDLRWAV